MTARTAIVIRQSLSSAKNVGSFQPRVSFHFHKFRSGSPVARDSAVRWQERMACARRKTKSAGGRPGEDASALPRKRQRKKTRLRVGGVIPFLILLSTRTVLAQSAPVSPDHPWHTHKHGETAITRHRNHLPAWIAGLCADRLRPKFRDTRPPGLPWRYHGNLRWQIP